VTIPPVVLDSHALLKLLRDEPGADTTEMTNAPTHNGLTYLDHFGGCGGFTLGL
jgi:hypothetical protein